MSQIALADRLGLPAALDTPAAQLMLSALGAEHGLCRLVGGVVRDTLLGLPVKDIDVATRLTPEQVMQRCQAAGLRTVPTGLAHGTVTVLANHVPFEVTTLRRDISTDGRRATVAFTDDWQEDAARRDFTINALYADPLSGTLHDYFGGRMDLAARRVRFIGAAQDRIAEDHLRLLRFFRFHARFGEGCLDEEGLAAAVAARFSLQSLSRERVRDELLQLLAVTDPVPTLAVMLDHGVLDPVLPEATATALPNLTGLISREQATGNISPLRRLAVLAGSGHDTLAALGGRFKLSRADQKQLTAMAGRPEQVPADALEAFFYWRTPEVARHHILLAAKSIDEAAAALARLDTFARPRMPLGGETLIAMGVPRGPAISRTLQALEARWVEAGFPMDATVVRQLARPLIEASADL